MMTPGIRRLMPGVIGGRISFFCSSPHAPDLRYGWKYDTWDTTQRKGHNVVGHVGVTLVGYCGTLLRH